MAELDGPKFKWAACGREFRWKPELAGKKAKCKCGAAVTVPSTPPSAAPAPPAVEHDPFETAGDPEQFAPPQFQAAPPPVPVAAAPQQLICPVCNSPALPTAVLCTACGYNFRTGQRMPGAGRGAITRGGPTGGVSADVYQQAAKFSWMAPLVAILLGCCTVGARGASPAVSLGIAGLQLLLILGGLGAGIFALFGAKKYGSAGVVAPAVIGIILNTLIIAANVVLLTMLLSGKFPVRNPPGGGGGAAGGAAAPRTRQQIQQQGEDAVLKEAGWVGVLQHRGAVVTLVTVPDTTPVAAEMLDNLKTPVSLLVVAVDNSRGGESFSIDPAGSTVTFTDGTTQDLPDVPTVLRSARSDRDQFVRQFSPPFEVMPGRQLAGKFMFLPPGTDASRIASVSVKIDGQPVGVAGRFMTAEEKQSAAAAGSR